MSWQRPAPTEVWRAVEIYLASAYGGKPPPAAARQRLEQLRSAGDENFYDSPVLERDSPNEPKRYMLRLGNRFYPHMKLAIEGSPDRQYLFRADTHDRHCRPAPDSREYAAFCELMQANQQIAEEIESAWEKAGVRTFKQFLREDLAKRSGTPVQGGSA